MKFTEYRIFSLIFIFFYKLFYFGLLIFLLEKFLFIFSSFHIHLKIELINNIKEIRKDEGSGKKRKIK